MSEASGPRAPMSRAAKGYIIVEVGDRPPGTVDVIINGETYEKANGRVMTVGGGRFALQLPGGSPRLVEVQGTKDNPMVIRL